MRRHGQVLDSPSVVDDALSSRDDVMSETAVAQCQRTPNRCYLRNCLQLIFRFELVR